MCWLSLLIIFVLAWVEISLFMQVAHIIGVLLTMLLVLFTSSIGISLVKYQCWKNFMLLQQKLCAGEIPVTELIRSVSLVLAGLLLFLPGFFTDFLCLLLLLPPMQKYLTLKLISYLKVWRGIASEVAPDSCYVTVECKYKRTKSSYN